MEVTSGSVTLRGLSIEYILETILSQNLRPAHRRAVWYRSIIFVRAIRRNGISGMVSKRFAAFLPISGNRRGLKQKSLLMQSIASPLRAT